MAAIPRAVSGRRLARASGRNGALIIQCQRIIGRKDWMNVWMFLNECDIRWFEKAASAILVNTAAFRYYDV